MSPHLGKGKKKDSLECLVITPGSVLSGLVAKNIHSEGTGSSVLPPVAEVVPNIRNSITS